MGVSRSGVKTSQDTMPMVIISTDSNDKNGDKKNLPEFFHNRYINLFSYGPTLVNEKLPKIIMIF